MDAIVQLALIEKLKKVFGAAGNVELSFPLLSPVSFTAAELSGISNPQTAEGYAASADFARSMNFIPRDIVASGSERMLWEIYRDLLDRAEVAGAVAGAAIEQRPDALLYVENPDGSRSDSEALKQYRQYRDAWFVASEDYAARKLSGELSEDPAVRQDWTDVEEPVLREEVADAKRDWETLGQREAVERALAADRADALNNPASRWSDWAKAFNKDIDMLLDAGGNHYAPTGFSPRNFAEQDDWLSFDLSAGEIATLADAAPAELKAVLGNQTASTIEKVRFEYRSVALVRPWFKPEAVTSRIWRSPDPDLQLSDGQVPPAGVCPGYTSACIFVRNLEVTTAGAATTESASGFFTLNAQALTLRALTADPVLTARAFRIKQGVAAAEAPTPVSMRAFRAIDHASIAVLARPVSLREDLPLSAEEEREIPPMLRLRRKVRPLRVPFRRWPGRFIDVMPTPTPPTPPAPTPPPPVETRRDEISVLAFIWKRFPKAPDPIPELTWT